MNNRPTLKRRLTILVMAGVLLVLSAKPALALFGVGDQTFNTTIADIPRSVAEAAQRATTIVKDRIKDSTAIAFKNATRTFLATITREFATSLATTQPGQKPLFLTNPKTFFRDVTDAAAGDFIDDFTRGVTGGRWDPRCDSTDPSVRAKCQGILGGSAGLGNPTSGERGRFIISRLLRAGSNATFEGCTSDCKTKWSFDQAPAITVPPSGITDLSQLNNYSKNFSNDYERSAALLNDWKTTILVPAAKTDPNQPWARCEDVWDKNSQQNGPAIESSWEFRLNWCAPGGEGSNCATTAQDCLNRVDQALLNDAAEASAGLRQCTTNCSKGFGADVRSFVNQATATDVFAYVENYDVRRAPAEIARRFSGNSDIGQYFSATGLLAAQIEEKVTGERTLQTTGVLPRTSSVSQKVLAPKEAASALFGIPFYNNNGELTFTGTGVADILKGLASFINSPVGKALFTYFRSKCGLNPGACKGPSNPQSVIGRIVFGNGGPTGIAAARIQFAGLGQIDYLNGDPGNNEVDVLGQLTSSGLIDPSFRTAVEENLTVRQAIDRKLLSRDKIVGFTKDGTEANNGYPFRSLQYLRKYRLIPVGWELAAKYSFSFRADDLTLGTLVDHYNICAQDVDHKVCSISLAACKSDTDCQTNETCGASPFCGLVDPDWVLKAPQTFCRRQGAGEEIVSKEFVCDQNNINKKDGSTLNPSAQVITSTPENDEDPGPANCVYDAEQNPFPDIGRWVVTRNTDLCADTQSCLAEDDQGNCLAYGYCVQERQTFKFDGTQCQSQNASCTTYTDRSGQKVSYLASTLNKNCSADSVGCGWYCAEPSYDQGKKAWQCTATSGDKVYLTSKAADCKAGDAGCRQFIRLIPGTNVLPNGNFEYYQGGLLNSDPAAFTGWSSGAISMVPVTATDTALASGNRVAVRVTAPSLNDTISQTVNFGTSLSERSFTFSIRTTSTSACSARLTLCTGPTCTNSGLSRTVTFNSASDWATAAVTLDVPSQSSLGLTDTRLTAVIQPDGCRNSGLQLDNAQVAEASDADQFADYGATNLIQLDGQRRACAAADVGCDKFTPLNGGGPINGILTNANRCTADQVGCQLYQREPISHVPQRDYNPASPTTGVDVTIIANKGLQCSAADVGCEEYTNLDTVAQGGEGKEYYKAVKQCVKPTNTAAAKKTYYTWYGDPDRGFVLRSQQLVVSNIPNAGPCTNLGFAQASGSGTTEPVCADTAATVAAATCSLADLSDNSDCAEFYDSNLNVFYRLRSATVSVTEDCHPYRNTVDETDPTYAGNKGRIYYLSRQENVSCTARAANCRAFTGNTGKTNRTVLRDTFEDRNLTSWVGGTWSTASPNAGGHSLRIDLAPGNNTAFAYTTVEAIAGKIAKNKTYLLKVTAAAASDSPNTQLRAFLGTEVAGSPGSFQTLGGVNFQGSTGVGLSWNDTITPSGPEWHTYTLGPVTLGDVINPQWRLGIGIDNGPGYIDSLTLVEVNDQTFLINNSAPQCPASAVGCTAYRNRSGQAAYATSFSRLCSDQVVGCEAMIDTQNSTSPFTQTVKNVITPADQIVTVVNDPANYCSANAKGCTMYGQPVFGRDDTVTSYKTVYKINNPDQQEASLCLASEDSCDIFTTADGTATYFKDPRTRTCEFRSGNGLTGGWYITGTTYRCPVITPPAGGQPVGQSCSPVCSGGTRAGKPCASVGNDVECPGSICAGDIATIGRIQDPNAPAGRAIFGQCSSSSQCLGGNQCIYLVGQCPDDESGCTEYRDPSDPQSCRSECPLELAGGTPISVDSNCVKTMCVSNDPNNRRNGQNCNSSNDCGTGGKCVGLDGTAPTTGAPGCRAYYYLRDSVEDTAGDCNGQVNTAIGCRPFNDTSNPILNFRGQ